MICTADLEIEGGYLRIGGCNVLIEVCFRDIFGKYFFLLYRLAISFLGYRDCVRAGAIGITYRER